MQPAHGRFDGETLVLERTSPRGTNRTTFTLAGDALEQRVAFNGETIVVAAYGQHQH